MCRIDGSDMVTVLSSGYRKARKEHRCSECRRPIMPAETYLCEATTFEGYFDTYKTCQHCIVARDWLIKNCHGFIYGDVMEEIEEHGQEYRQLRMPLYRVVAGARRKWRGFKGGLMPVPAMPPAITV